MESANSPANNFFNSAHSYFGVAVSNVGDLPQLSGAAGSFGNFDMHTMDVTSLLNAGDRIATVSASTYADVFFINAVILSITTWEGRICEM